ncbi:hypothetical protein EQG68_00390 [Flavobacterium piscinae]|uniref:PA-phosphatase n=1 Tax=Flavobacterium piscinae TaxID=2506424 RepID=A0A4Q1KZS9_9FLAO|nr:hypothetical protein [Flavobacterium piscinae]RXR35385.1 hypothetical protein EQG68_00390 [Flavobacterium piscinae]
MKNILPIFSYLFHPLFISVYAAAFFFILFLDFFVMQEIYLYMIQIIIITVLIPISLFYLLLSLGKVDSIMIVQLSQRKFPLMVNCILLLILTQKSITIDRIPELYFFFFGAFWSTVLAIILLFLKIKASLHMLGMATLTFFIIGLSSKVEVPLLYTIATFITLNGFVASSRLQMKAHTFFELIIGFFCGAIPQFCMWYFWL